MSTQMFSTSNNKENGYENMDWLQVTPAFNFTFHEKKNAVEEQKYQEN